MAPSLQYCNKWTDPNRYLSRKKGLIYLQKRNNNKIRLLYSNETNFGNEQYWSWAILQPTRLRDIQGWESMGIFNLSPRLVSKSLHFEGGFHSGLTERESVIYSIKLHRRLANFFRLLSLLQFVLQEEFARFVRWSAEKLMAWSLISGSILSFRVQPINK